MIEEKNTKLTTLVIPAHTKSGLNHALHEIINLAPHGVISKNTISTIKQLQSSLRKNHYSKPVKNIKPSSKL